MAVRKTKKGAALKRWFKEKWKDEKGNTWKGVGKRKAAVVAEKKRVGMGRRTSALRKRKKSTKKKK